MSHDHVAETISVSITTFTAQTYGLHRAPPFGSFLRVASSEEGIDIYAVVSNIQTAPVDQGRPVTARGEALENEAQVYADNPHFQQVLRTTFHGIVVGFMRGANVYHQLPPQPPRIHGFVYPCTNTETAAFAQRPDFLRLLKVAAATSDLITAVVTNAALAQPDRAAYLTGAGKNLLAMFADQPERVGELLELLAAQGRELVPPPVQQDAPPSTVEEEEEEPAVLHERA